MQGAKCKTSHFFSFSLEAAKIGQTWASWGEIWLASSHSLRIFGHFYSVDFSGPGLVPSAGEPHRGLGRSLASSLFPQLKIFPSAHEQGWMGKPGGGGRPHTQGGPPRGGVPHLGNPIRIPRAIQPIRSQFLGRGQVGTLQSPNDAVDSPLRLKRHSKSIPIKVLQCSPSKQACLVL